MKEGENPAERRETCMVPECADGPTCSSQLYYMIGVLKEAGKLGTAVIPQCNTSITVSSFLLIINFNALLAFASK